MPVSARNRRVKVRTLIRACRAIASRSTSSCSRSATQSRVAAVLVSARRRQRPLDELATDRRLATGRPRRAGPPGWPRRRRDRSGSRAGTGRCRRPRPALVRMSPSSTNSTSGSSLTSGNRRRKSSAQRPVRGRRAAVQQPGGGQHERAGADRHQPRRSANPRPSAAAHVRRQPRSISPCSTWMPATITVSAVSISSGPCSGRDQEAGRRSDRLPVRGRDLARRSSAVLVASRAPWKICVGTPRSNATTPSSASTTTRCRSGSGPVMARFFHMMAVRPLVTLSRLTAG